MSGARGVTALASAAANCDIGVDSVGAAGVAANLRGYVRLLEATDDRLVVHATWRVDSPVSTAHMIADAAKADVLMIDDFAGAGGPDKREWVAETAWKLLEARQSVAGPLLVTTNRTTAEIEATYGEAVASRLAALCAVLDVRGDDERRRVA